MWKTVGIPGGDWVLRAERVQEIVEVKLIQDLGYFWRNGCVPVAVEQNEG